MEPSEAEKKDFEQLIKRWCQPGEEVVYSLEDVTKELNIDSDTGRKLIKEMDIRGIIRIRHDLDIFEIPDPAGRPDIE